MIVLTCDQVRQVDRRAIEELGIPGIVLMENAGRNAAQLILQRYFGASDGVAGILCGGGNNGGDGYVIARHLHNAGVKVRVFAAVEPARLKGDAAINCAIVLRMGLPVELLTSPVRDAPSPGMDDMLAAAAQSWQTCSVLVDALLGTGFAGQVRQPTANIIERVNQSERPVVAIDLPSGLDGDTGQPSTRTIRAVMTVTFAAMKLGLTQPHARPWAGEILVADIGVPPELIETIWREGRAPGHS